MKGKSRMILLFAVTLMILLSDISVETKTKPKLEAGKKATTVGQKYQLKLNGVPGRADHPVLNSGDVTLYHLSESYKDYITYDSSNLREYRFRVSGTKKEVRDWKISGEDAGYFKITDYGLLRLNYGPAYVAPCVTATVTAVLEDGRKLTAAVRAYSEVNIYIDKLFADFEGQYITPSMTTKEKAEKAAWYISTTSDYELYNYNWLDIFLKGKGDCYASRYALQYLCNYMGIKAVACRNLDDHGKRWFMQMAYFMSSLPALMSQSQDRMEFMKSAVGLWKIWQKRINLTWIISAGKRGHGLWML
ncbi:hypothetical protein C806_02921 [Lachnospiraceae bacterium 3-1]|nr:hypothetical protein C806_02921 [Lachnospiraceae bacterium 3-1]